MARTGNLISRTLTACCLIASLACVTPAVEAAEADPFDGRLLPLELVMAHRKEIGLTADQNKQIGALVVDMQKAVADKQWRMQSAYFDLMAVLDEPQVDEAKALDLARQAVDTENEIKLEQMRLLIRVRNVLTTEQIATLRAKASG